MWPNCLTPQLLASWYSARILFFLALWYSYVFRSSLIILLAPCTLPGFSYYARILFFPGPWYFYSDHGLYDFVFFQRKFVYFSHKIIICRFDYYFYTQLSLFLKLTSAQAIVEKFFVQGNNDISRVFLQWLEPVTFQLQVERSNHSTTPVFFRTTHDNVFFAVDEMCTSFLFWPV